MTFGERKCGKVALIANKRTQYFGIILINFIYSTDKFRSMDVSASEKPLSKPSEYISHSRFNAFTTFQIHQF